MEEVAGRGRSEGHKAIIPLVGPVPALASDAESRYAWVVMPEPTWAPPIQSLDIAPEKKPRLPWLNARNVLILSIIGYALDFLHGTPGKVFNLIGLIGLVLGFVILVENMVESGIHRKWNGRQLLIGWLLVAISILIGTKIIPI